MRLLKRHRLMAITLVMSTCCVLGLENLDTILTNLNKPATEMPTVAGAKEPVAVTGEPKVAPMIEPEAKEAGEPKTVVNQQAKIAKMVEPEPKAVAPVITPSLPKNIITGAQPKVVAPIVPPAPQVFHPAVMPTAPIQPNMNVTAKSPELVVAKTIQQPQVQVVDVQEVSSAGLDTLNIESSGNWLEKRVWYKKSEQLFDVIRTNLQKAADIRMSFVGVVNKTGQQIDEFYENVSFQKGQIDELLQALLQDLNTQTEVRGGDLSSSERSLKDKVLAEQKQFESMSKDLKLIDDLDEQIDKTMTKAFKEIDTCRGLETRAWNNFKEIGLELDDKKARTLYYEMENFHKNIEQKMNYLQSNLLPYLQNQLVGKVNDTINQIKTSVQALDTKGLNLKTLLQKNEQGDFVVFKEREKLKEQEAEAAFKSAQEAQHLAKQKQQAKKTLMATCPWYQRWFCAVIDYVEPITSKFIAWFMIVVCCVQCVVCKIQEFICRLLGY